MGCDGGTIPRRDELVRTKQKPEQKDKDAETVAKWKHCAISQRALKAPIVSCDLGKLYNKDSVIEFLLNKESAVHPAEHIKTLKDVKELNLTQINGFQKKAADMGDEYVDRQASQYICPVVGLEMNGRHKFCYLRQCGCALSDRALKQVKTETCHKCGKPFVEDDIIVINGSEEEMEELRKKMEARKLQAKLQKRTAKKRLNVPEETTSVAEKKIKTEAILMKPGTSGSTQQNGNAAVKATTSKLSDPEKLKNFTVSKNPKASEAYKSLFTTHKTALDQPKAHWITHNPLFY